MDITSPESLQRSGLWEGVQQVVLTVGTVFGPLPEGGFGVRDGMTSERVEAEGEAGKWAVCVCVLVCFETEGYPVAGTSGTVYLQVWQRSCLK